PVGLPRGGRKRPLETGGSAETGGGRNFQLPDWGKPHARGRRRRRNARVADGRPLMSKLSHLDDQGRASMVDVSPKTPTERIASAEATILLSEEAFTLALSGNAPKGDVLATARIAGIMAAKKTSELIPLCHPLSLSHAGIEFTPDAERHALKIVA